MTDKIHQGPGWEAIPWPDDKSGIQGHYQHAVDAIKDICIQYGIALVGSNYYEGILSEISIVDVNNIKSAGWDEEAVRKRNFNKVHSITADDKDLVVDAIGELPEMERVDD